MKGCALSRKPWMVCLVGVWERRFWMVLMYIPQKSVSSIQMKVDTVAFGRMWALNVIVTGPKEMYWIGSLWTFWTVAKFTCLGPTNFSCRFAADMVTVSKILRHATSMYTSSTGIEECTTESVGLCSRETRRWGRHLIIENVPHCAVRKVMEKMFNALWTSLYFSTELWLLSLCLVGDTFKTWAARLATVWYIF